MSFAENLQFIRTKNQVTQEQLAETLGVSRQSVSKWESGMSFPEMDTILRICDLYHVGLDDLMRGSVAEHHQEEAEGFIRHMKAFSIQVAAAVAMIIAGVGAAALIDAYLPGYESLAGALFMGIVMVATVIFIASGMEHDRYTKKHPKLRSIYTEQETERFDHRFTWMIAGSIGLILLGIVQSILLDDMGYGDLAGGIFMMFVAVSAGVMVFGGIRRSMYHVEEYNKENVTSKVNKKQSAVCGVIMLLATAVFFVWGFWGTGSGDYNGHWGSSWLAFPVGGLLCGVASILMGINEKEDGSKSTGENKE